MDNRLAVCVQIKHTGGCISCKQIIHEVKNKTPGQYNLEINFQFRFTDQFSISAHELFPGKNKNEMSFPISLKNYPRAKLTDPVPQAQSAAVT